MAETPAKVRLFQRAVRQTPVGSGEKSMLQSVGSHSSFLPPREPLKPRLIRCRSKETQFKGTESRSVKSQHQSPGGRRLRVTHKPKKLSDSMSVEQSLGTSYAPSRDQSPRSSLTLEAINLELQLTAALEQVESLPAAIRSQRRIQAYLDVWEATAAREPVFGHILLHLKREAERTLKAAKVPAMSDLQIQNTRLTQTLTELKTIAKNEKDNRQGRDRVLENLAKENALLQKKNEELEGMLRRTALRGRRQEGNLEAVMSDLREKTRKIKELDEEVKAARVRESKLTALLNWMQESNRSEAWGTEEGIQNIPLRMQDHSFSRHALVPTLDLRTEEDQEAEEEQAKPLDESTSSSSALIATPGQHAETQKWGH